MSGSMLNIGFCADDLDVSEQTILNHIRAGKLKAKRFGRLWRIPVAEWQRFKDAAPDATAPAA